MTDQDTPEEVRWHSLGSVFSDPGPGMAQGWSVSIAKNDDKTFSGLKSSPASDEEDEDEYFEADDSEEIGDAKEAAYWIEMESGLSDMSEVIAALQNAQGFELLLGYLKGEIEEDKEE